MRQFSLFCLKRPNVFLYGTLCTRRVVLVDLLEGLHGDFGSRWQQWHVSIDDSIHAEVVVFVKATASLHDRQALVSRVEQHLGVTTELSTW